MVLGHPNTILLRDVYRETDGDAHSYCKLEKKIKERRLFVSILHIVLLIYVFSKNMRLILHATNENS